MQYLLPHSELNLQFSKRKFAIDTQQQIVKDFAQYNLSFSDDFSLEPYSIEVIEQLIGERLIELMKEGETRLLQLLYTIDLPEKEFLRLTTEPEFIQLLSERILLREAYKVFLRWKFPII